MSVKPLLPFFHKFNKLYFDNSLVRNFEPIVKVRWSDNRLKTTAGFYKRSKANGNISSEIVLSKPILESLPLRDIQSTLCHEMIHVWIDRVLKINEIHGINFVNKMNEINKRQNLFKITIRHNFPVYRNEIKYKGYCLNCGLTYLYRRRMKNIACKSCCNLFFNGNWDEKCLIVFDK
tara:strand:- start:78 stop:608 length:531 start_codon:yes stop_codon:yes gene_type:complete